MHDRERNDNHNEHERDRNASFDDMQKWVQDGLDMKRKLLECVKECELMCCARTLRTF